MTEQHLKSRFTALAKRIVGTDAAETYRDDNVLKRVLYAECELLRLDVQEGKEFANTPEAERIVQELLKFEENFVIGRHTYIHTYIHICIYAYMHTYIHSYMHVY